MPSDIKNQEIKYDPVMQFALMGDVLRKFNIPEANRRTLTLAGFEGIRARCEKSGQPVSSEIWNAVCTIYGVSGRGFEK